MNGSEVAYRLRGVTDGNGDWTEDGNPLELTGVTFFDPGSGGDMQTLLGDATDVSLGMIVDFDADIRSSDRIRVPDPSPWKGTYDVARKPGRWQSPFTGRKGGQVVALNATGEEA